MKIKNINVKRRGSTFAYKEDIEGYEWRTRVRLVSDDTHKWFVQRITSQSDTVAVELRPQWGGFDSVEAAIEAVMEGPWE